LAYKVSCFESEEWDMASKEVSQPELEIESDGWERFERAVDTVSKSGPQHRVRHQKMFEITDDMRVIFASICDRRVEETPAFAQACRAFEGLSPRLGGDEKRD
jgi:hypothetical protein